MYSMAVISILVLLSSPYFSLISNNSFLITANIFSSLLKINLNSSIIFNNSANSFSIFSLSKPVKRLSFISNIALACASLRPNWAINPLLASSSPFDAFISLIIASIWSKAIFKPSNIWTLFSAASKSNWVLRIIISLWKSMYLEMISLRPRVLGTPWSNIKKIIP